MRSIAIAMAALALAGCGSREMMKRATEELNTFDLEEPALAASGPQIAYTYAISYRLPGGAIGATQARHLALCRALGAARCSIVESDLDQANGDDQRGTTRLLVAAPIARSFGQRLDATAAAADGDVSRRHVSAQDVTKQIVDTQARVRAKQALADRLLRVIQTANGPVGNLVQAERAYADTQEQLDAARTMAAALRQRVAMSEVNIDYASRAATGVWAPVNNAVSGAGGTLALSSGALVTFIVAAFPWIIPFGLLLWGLRSLWRRRPWRRRPSAPPLT